MVCPKCNSRTEDGVTYCPACGFRLSGEALSAETSSGNTAHSPVVESPTRRDHSRRTAIIIAAALILLLAILIAGRRAYTERGEAEAQSGLIRQSQDRKGFGNDSGSISQTASSTPSEPGPNTPVQQVPLRPDLIVVTAIGAPEGDYESIKRIMFLTDESMAVSYSADVPNMIFAPGNPHGMKTVVKRVKVARLVLREDIKSSHFYMQGFSEKDQEVIPGTTAMTTSSAVLEDLKGKGQASISFQTPDMGGMSTENEVLQRIELRPVPFPVLLNDQRVDLPAIHAKGPMQTSHSSGIDEKGFFQRTIDWRADFYFLDSPENPLVLSWDLGPGVGKLQVIKISFPEPEPKENIHGASSPKDNTQSGLSQESAPASGNGATHGDGPGGQVGTPSTSASVGTPQIGRTLAKTGRAEVYGIYFDFGKAIIRDESEPVLKEIASTLADNPSWKLKVEGHTDNVGGDAYNLELSKQRAEAVKQALVTQYHVTADRLSTAGFGASQPKETNDTLAGRARNRRVELARMQL